MVTPDAARSCLFSLGAEAMMVRSEMEKSDVNSHFGSDRSSHGDFPNVTRIHAVEEMFGSKQFDLSSYLARTIRSKKSTGKVCENVRIVDRYLDQRNFLE